jgi:GNAT superfamily N-acetyltransferase
VVPEARDVTSDLDVALAADRALRRRAAREAIALTAGLAVRHPELHDVHYVNAVLLDRGAVDLDGAGVAAVAERFLGDLGHRHVVFDDPDAGERAAVELGDAGWERGRTVFMVFAGDPAAVKPEARARPVSEAEMDALQMANLLEQVPDADTRDLAARLLATQRRLRATTPARCFGAGEPAAEPVSMCTLFLNPDVEGRRVAMVTDVGTRLGHRERGLGRAVVSAAVAHAGDWGADLVVVGADADDWPQLMYAGLGFEAVGRQVTLTRRTWAPSGSVSGGV